MSYCRSMTTEDFIHAFKEFIARKGTSKFVVSDRTKTFKTAAKAISQIRKDEGISSFLSNRDWTEIQFVKSTLVGWFLSWQVEIMKMVLSKEIGHAVIPYNKLVIISIIIIIITFIQYMKQVENIKSVKNELFQGWVCCV